MLIQQIHNLPDLPNVVGDSCFHRGGHSKAFMNSAEVVMHEVKGESVIQVLDLLAEGVSEPRHSPHGHADGEVVPLRVARGDMLLVGVAVYNILARADAGRRTVSHLVLWSGRVELHEQGVVNIGPESILHRQRTR